MINFNAQEWTGTDEEWGLVRYSPEIKSRESSGKVPGEKKSQKQKISDQKKNKKK